MKVRTAVLEDTIELCKVVRMSNGLPPKIGHFRRLPAGQLLQHRENSQ